MTALYNEFDPFAAAWLAELVAQRHIAEGRVDGRSVLDIRPADLAGHTQVHLFAGIGVWSHALRLSGWPDDRAVWTASCPCQPFSAAGKGGGFDDERHLWPAAFWHIDHCRPPAIFGEQVASPDGLAWLDLVFADLEGAGYACWATDLCAAGVGAPHIRQRLYWCAIRLADAEREGLEGQPRHGDDRGQSGRLGADATGPVASGSRDGRLEHTQSDGRLERRAEPRRRGVAGGRGAGGLADTHGGHAGAEGLQRGGQHGQQPEDGGSGLGDRRPGPTNGFWGDADWILCRDGKWRPVGSGTFPLAHGAAGRVGRLRGYGNAINAYQAAAFIRSVSDALARPRDLRLTRAEDIFA